MAVPCSRCRHRATVLPLAVLVLASTLALHTTLVCLAPGCLAAPVSGIDRNGYNGADGLHGIKDDHTYTFIVSAQLSGARLIEGILAQYPDVSIFNGGSANMPDSQHAQKLFKPANKLGGMVSYAFKQEAHLTEASALATPANARALHSSWSDYWDLRKPVLVDSCPRNAFATRFLQAVFGRKHSKFIVVMQHPLRAWYWTLANTWQQVVATCARPFIKHWLQANKVLLATDLHALDNVLIVSYEQLVFGSLRERREIVVEIAEFLGLSTNIHLVGPNIVPPELVTRYHHLRKTQPEAFNTLGQYIGMTHLLPAKFSLEDVDVQSGDEGGDGLASIPQDFLERLKAHLETLLLHHAEEPFAKANLKGALKKLSSMLEASASRPGSRSFTNQVDWEGRIIVDLHHLVDTELEQGWQSTWKDAVDFDRESCQPLLDMYERALSPWGYSMQHMSIATPPIFATDVAKESSSLRFAELLGVVEQKSSTHVHPLKVPASPVVGFSQHLGDTSRDTMKVL